ncbi:hypothetical protein CASFOL_009461 [Castilleja foliolosa]|uniref:Neprosin PEP catalytic domain-containing protein n=1 Tax=Castilleja foliolosa TaxID=1961234 RepID=A0ABD3DXZ6_9LAMI
MISICCKISTTVFAFVAFIIFTSSVNSVQSVNVKNTNQSSDQLRVESEKLKHIKDYLWKIYKPAVKTIQSPDGDLIDCVLSHQQPAFDHPLLKRQWPLTAPSGIPNGPTSHNNTINENFQVWRMSGESCPEDTVPIRRITEEDVLRASSVRTFGRKPHHVRKESIGDNHEHAIVYVKGSYNGASAVMDVWAPTVETSSEFSLSQVWVMAGSLRKGDLNTIEAGWQVYPDIYGDNAPRLFIYWTVSLIHFLDKG